MNCINCGAHLTESDQEYCPRCGFNVRIQRKVDYLSKFYYNQGLEKATIRDLSGAIGCLKQSLSYNKNNIQARNLLGLVYFETGEVVAALSEWVISKNLQPRKNLASEYIERLQENPNKLEAINDTIKKYNQSLILCRQGHDDMAAIQLRKLLSQNSKLIKGYHLLALIYMKNHEWNRARRVLRRAAKIDKTNTTTLRFLKEVDERTGVVTRLDDEKGRKSLFGRLRSGGFRLGNLSSSGRGDAELYDPEAAMDHAMVIPIRQTSYRSLFGMLALGIAAGAFAFYLLILPGIRQGIYRQANEQIIRYSESLSSQSSELARAQDVAEESNSTALNASNALTLQQVRNQSLQHLFAAYIYYRQDYLDSAAVELMEVYKNALPDSAMSIYNLIVSETGVRGNEEPLNFDDLEITTDDVEMPEVYAQSGSYDYYDYDDYDYDDYDY